MLGQQRRSNPVKRGCGIGWWKQPLLEIVRHYQAEAMSASTTPFTTPKPRWGSQSSENGHGWEYNLGTPSCSLQRVFSAPK
jgi:hypothetical protein